MSDPKQIPPNLSDVIDYLAFLGSTISAEHFCDYYESNGWMVGKVKMKNWQATARNWHRTDTQRKAQAKSTTMTEWERKQKVERIRELRERQRAICYPGGSAYPVTLTPEKRAIVAKLHDNIAAINKELEA